MDRQPHSRLRLAGRLLVLAIMATLFAWGVMTTGISRIASKLDENFWLAIIAAQPLVLAAIATMGMRLSELVRRPRIAFPVGIKAYALFAGLNLFLPARLAELIKATYVRDHAGVPLSQGFAGILIGILLDLAVFSVIALFCLTFVVDRTVSEDTRKVFVLLAAASLALIVLGPLVLRPFAGNRLVHAVAKIPYLGVILARIADHAFDQVSAARMTMFMAFSVVGWGCTFAMVLTVLTVLGQSDPGPAAALAVLFGMTAGALIPVLPGGLGTSEAGVVLILMALGESFDTSLVAAVAVRLASSLSPVVLASLIVVHERTGLRALLTDLYRVAAQFRNRPPER